MNKESKEAIEKLKSDIKKPLVCGDIVIVCIEDLETVLNYIDNSIPKEVVEKKMNEIETKRRAIDREESSKIMRKFAYKEKFTITHQELVILEENNFKYGQVKILKELLEGK